jgi:hypothetical protein
MKNILIAIGLISLLSCQKQLLTKPDVSSAVVSSNSTLIPQWQIKQIVVSPPSKSTPVAQWLDFSYTATGLPLSVIYRNSVGDDDRHPNNLRMTYDKNGRLTLLNHEDYVRTYFYSGSSLLPSRDSTFSRYPDDGSFFIDLSFFTYDALGRLETIRKMHTAGPYLGDHPVWDSTLTTCSYNSLGDMTLRQVTTYSPGGISVLRRYSFTYATAKSILKTHRVWQQIFEDYSAHERVAPLTTNTANLPEKSRTPGWPFGPSSFRASGILGAVYVFF